MCCNKYVSIKMLEILGNKLIQAASWSHCLLTPLMGHVTQEKATKRVRNILKIKSTSFRMTCRGPKIWNKLETTTKKMEIPSVFKHINTFQLIFLISCHVMLSKCKTGVILKNKTCILWTFKRPTNLTSVKVGTFTIWLLHLMFWVVLLEKHRIITQTQWSKYHSGQFHTGRALSAFCNRYPSTLSDT